MTIAGISDNVQKLLVGSGKFVSVLPNPPTKDDDFDGFPSACHYYVDAESSYATVSQNQRVLEYVVELYLVTNKDTDEATRFAEMYDLIDYTMQMFDETIDLSEGLGQTLSPALTRACDQMRATPSELTRINTDKGPGLMCTLRLFCMADVAFV